MDRTIVGTAAAVLLMSFGAASAQAPDGLPAACGAHAGHTMAMPATPMAGMPADEAHADLMAGMDAMNAAMASSMSADDIDVAFVCGMIVHHRGAIAMAEAELAHGDDPWVRDLAQKVIDAQTQEIADMEAWLARIAP